MVTHYSLSSLMRLIFDERGSGQLQIYYRLVITPQLVTKNTNNQQDVLPTFLMHGISDTKDVSTTISTSQSTRNSSEPVKTGKIQFFHRFKKFGFIHRGTQTRSLSATF